MAEIAMMNLNTYATHFGASKSGLSKGIVEGNDYYLFSAPDADWENFGNLGGEECLPDTPLEFALLSYYSPPVINIRPVEAKEMLPANDPRTAGLKLGMAVYEEMQETRYSDPRNTDRIGRYAGMLKFISDKNGVTEKEITDAFRAAVRNAVDEEFNRIGFVLDKGTSISYNAVLTRNTKTGEYTLSYERPSVQNDDKKLSAASLHLLLALIGRSSDFDQNCVTQVRDNAAQIPAVVFARAGNDSIDVIKDILLQFYATPNQTSYNALKSVYLLYFNARLTSGDSFFGRTRDAYEKALAAINPDLAQKIVSEVETLAARNTLTQDQSAELTKTNVSY